MIRSRKKNATLNIFFGYITQIAIFILSLVSRRIFLKFLSIDYLGINGLYSNILSVLALPELGLDTAVVFSLYKPVADDDSRLIYSLLAYFKKVYYTIAIVIFSIGMMIIPFLKYIISSNLPLNSLIIYYVLFLTNTVVTYLVAHKVALLSASQNQRIQKIISLMTTIILQILQIVVLCVWANYYIYLLCTIVSTVISNIILDYVCNRIYPEIFRKQDKVNIDKRNILNTFYATFVYKIGVVAINNTDNILISMLVSTAAVGLYSNYCSLITALRGFIAVITTSLISGIGSLAATGNRTKQLTLFNTMLLFYHTIAAMSFVGFNLLFNNVIEVWLGEQYIFNNIIVFIISLNFYIDTAITPVWMYREANGIFKDVRYLMIARASLNIALSIIFGKLWGVFGILFATTISLLLTNFLYEPRILFQKVFCKSCSLYWIKQMKYFVLTIGSLVICYMLNFYIGSSLFQLLAKAIIIVIIVPLVFVLFNRHTPEFEELIKISKDIFAGLAKFFHK
jgi:O-antigen/teichoic acid export membrane protein